MIKRISFWALSLGLIVTSLNYSAGCGGTSSSSSGSGGSGGTTVPDAAAVSVSSSGGPSLTLNKGAVAASTDNGRFGAIMANNKGEMLLPIVDRDSSGAPSTLTGVVWSKVNGTPVTVYLDPTTHLPTKTVIGDFVFLFSNWDTNDISTAKTADVATVYAPNGYINITRSVDTSQAGLALSGGTRP